MDNNTYYDCTCYYFNDDLMLCKDCSKRVDDVEPTVQTHLNEFKPVVHAKTWKNNKKNTNQKMIMFISLFLIQ